MGLLTLLPILLSLLGAFIVYAFKYDKTKQKNIVLSIVVILVFISCLINCFIDGLHLEMFKMAEILNVSLKVDGLSRFFSVAISFVWIIVTFYTFEYIKHEKYENRFYTFFFATLAMLIALCYSANLVTMYLTFEMITLISMPLVLHSLTKESINAAKKYLFYSIGGAFLALLGIFYLVAYCGNADFGSWGGLEVFKLENFSGNKQIFNVVIFMLIVGFATKAGMFPLHGWLPSAHPVAPSPASAVLSGVITKAGVIAIIRVVYYVIGPDFIANTWVQYAWLGLAIFTVLMGSLLAYFEKTFKKRLAYSSVSQLSYILVGLAILTSASFTGALIHVAAHMLIKVCLFLFAGEMIYKFNAHRVDEFDGIGKIMPISTWAYTFASLGLVGIPLTGGFVSKWYLATSSVASNVPVFNYLVPIVLLISAILTAGYLFPITIKGFFTSGKTYEKNEAKPLMYVPMMILSILVLVIGIYSQPLLDLINLIIGR